MEYSENYNFNLPSKSDETSADVDLISDNFRTVDDIVKQVQDDVSKMPTNLVNGSAEGSLRGIYTKAENDEYRMDENAVALGYGTKASGHISYAEGYNTTASGNYSHAECDYTTASGAGSHAEGGHTTASGADSHAEGYNTTASSNYSHAEGEATIAGSRCQHAQGKYNIEDNDNKYLHIVGNGEDGENRSNAHTLDWSGNAWFAGDVYVGGTSQDDESATKLSSVATDISQVKEKLDGIEEGANKTIVDSELSDTSTNPVQNKVVTEKINSANSTITSINSALDTKVTREVAIVGSDKANSAGWYKVADGTVYPNTDVSMLFAVHSTEGTKSAGILQLNLRSTSSTTTCQQFGWLVRNGFNPNNLIIATNGRSWAMYFKVLSTQYYRTFFEVIQKSSTNSSTLAGGYALYTNSVVETAEPTATYTSADLGVIKTINEKLDKKADTETGTCTLSASNGTVSNATYSVVGDFVTLNFNIAPTGAGNVVVSGLPFTATKNQSGFASSTATYNITANQISVSINITSGTAEYCTVTYLK